MESLEHIRKRKTYTMELVLLTLLEEYWGMKDGNELTLMGFITFLREKVLKDAEELRHG